MYDFYSKRPLSFIYNNIQDFYSFNKLVAGQESKLPCQDGPGVEYISIKL